MRKPRLLWNEQHYGFGIPEIDAQHREIVERVNAIIDAVDPRSECPAVREQMKSFAQFVREHFAEEENLMHQYGFPGMAAHIARHHQLLEQLDNVGMRLCSPALSGSKAELFLVFLVDWTELHISHVDRELAAFLAGSGMVAEHSR